MATKMFSPYPWCHKVRSALLEFFRSLDKGRMWWYNILGYNKGSISGILRIGPITARYILLTAGLVAPKRENPEPILILKRTEWRKFIGCFCLIIETYPYRVGKITYIFFRIGYITRPSYVRLHMPRQHL